MKRKSILMKIKDRKGYKKKWSSSIKVEICTINTWKRCNRRKRI